MRLENCCVKEIRRGKSPKYAEISNVIVFAQKCNTKYNGIDISLAQYLDETTIKRYPTDEHMQDGDIVINSTEQVLLDESEFIEIPIILQVS